MADGFEFTGDQAQRAMLEGLTSRIRDELRKRIMQRIEPDIEAAVDAGLAAFKATVESYRDPMMMRDTVRVLIERKDGNAAVGQAGKP
jgi:hypothetical protein